jgi:Concanavalin A-like lectin/glucanases superfamily
MRRCPSTSNSIGHNMKTTTCKRPRILTLLLMQVCVVLGFAAGTPVLALPPLVAHWKFDEPTGSGSVADSIGSNTSTLPPGASITSMGISGNKLTLSSGGFVNVGKVLQFTGPFSISSWVQTKATDCSVVVSTNMNGTNTGYILGINKCGVLGLPNHAFFNLAGSAATPVSTGNNVNDGSWHHVVGVFDPGSPKPVLIYVDAVPELKTLSTTLTITYDPGSFFVIGGTTGSPNIAIRSFIGDIDEVQVYNGALSDAEVGELFRNQPTPPTPQPPRPFLATVSFFFAL